MTSHLEITTELFTSVMSSDDMRDLVELGIMEAVEFILPSVLPLTHPNPRGTMDEVARARSMFHTYFTEILKFVSLRAFDLMIERLTISSPSNPLIFFFNQDVRFALVLLQQRLEPATESNPGFALRNLSQLTSALQCFWVIHRQRHLELLNNQEEKTKAVSQRALFVNRCRVGGQATEAVSLCSQSTLYGSACDIWILVEAIVGVVMRTHAKVRQLVLENSMAYEAGPHSGNGVDLMNMTAPQTLMPPGTAVDPGSMLAPGTAVGPGSMLAPETAVGPQSMLTPGTVTGWDMGEAPLQWLGMEDWFQPTQPPN